MNPPEDDPEQGSKLATEIMYNHMLIQRCLIGLFNNKITVV
jgi:hypothetical protein